MSGLCQTARLANPQMRVGETDLENLSAVKAGPIRMVRVVGWKLAQTVTIDRPGGRRFSPTVRFRE